MLNKEKGEKRCGCGETDGVNNLKKQTREKKEREREREREIN